MSGLTELEQQLAQNQADLDQCLEVLAEDPDDTSVLELIQELETQIAQLKKDISAHKTSRSAASPVPAADAPPPPPPEHPSTPQDIPPPPPPPSSEHAQTFNVGDTVLAKFSQDRQFYQAKVISKTGSLADPVYYVHFIGYPDKENKRSHEVRPIENKKRKAESTPAASTPAARVPSVPIQNGAVITAAPSLEPPPPARHTPSMVSDGPTRMAPEPKKLKTNKKLEKAASSWQNFRKNGPKNAVSGLSKKQLGKDSMFRTSDLPSARVGVIGSGKTMQKDNMPTSWKPQKQDAYEPDAD